MRWLSLLVALLLCGAGAAESASAQAQRSTGLYAPFPSPAGGDLAQRYVDDFGIRAFEAELQRGRYVRRPSGPEPRVDLRAVPPGGATERATAPGPGWPAVALLVAIAAAGLLVAAWAPATPRIRRIRPASRTAAPTVASDPLRDAR